MSTSKFVPSTALILVALVALILLAAFLLVSGYLEPVAGDSKQALRYLRAALLGTAVAGFGAAFFMLYGRLSNPTPIDGKWLNLAIGGATLCLVAAWFLSNLLR